MNIPPDFQMIFWDRPAETLEWEKDKFYITARALEYGNFPILNWFHEKCQLYDFIPTFLKTSYARQLSLRTVNFWKTIYNIKKLPWETTDYLKNRKQFWIH